MSFRTFLRSLYTDQSLFVITHQDYYLYKAGADIYFFFAGGGGGGGRCCHARPEKVVGQEGEGKRSKNPREGGTTNFKRINNACKRINTQLPGYHLPPDPPLAVLYPRVGGRGRHWSRMH